jgi:hypothetical protein
MTPGPLIVVLRFVSGIRVDMVDGMSEQEAIADFAGRALRTATVELPLLEALTIPVPTERILELAGVYAPPPPVVARPSISLAGMVGAVRGYTASLAADRSPAAVEDAAKRISEFFGRYGVDIDFRVAAPVRKAE